MPPVAAIGAGLAGAAGSIGGAAAGAAGGLGGLGSAISGIGSVASSIGGMGAGGTSGGADPLAMYAAQVQQAQLANLERQEISDDYFDSLIGPRKIQRGPNKGKTVYGSKGKLLMGQKPVDVFGKRPEYREVDFQTMLDQDPGLAGIAGDVTAGNAENFRSNRDLSSAINQFLTDDARSRVSAFDPYLLGNMEETGRAASLAARGILPTSDQQDIARSRNESTGIFGTAGTSRGQVAKDLGLSRLDLQTRIAPALTAQNAALANSIAPPQLRDDPRSYQVGTGQALQIGAADNQFEATFDRSEQNLRSLLASMPKPAAQGLFNLQNTLRSQQFAIDFGLANGYGVPGTMPDNLGGDSGSLGFMQSAQGVGNAFQTVAGLLGGGGSVGTPGIFG